MPAAVHAILVRLGRLRAIHVLPALCAAIVGLRHLLTYYCFAHLLHPVELAEGLRALDRGELWSIRGQQLGDTPLQVGGLLYTVMMLPARLVDNPVLGIFLWHCVMELLAIGVWIVLGLRSGVRRELVLGAALFLALYAEPKLEPLENHTVMCFVAIALFAVLLTALRSSRLWPMVLAGVLLGLAVHLHQSSVALGPAELVAVLAWPEHRWRRLLALTAGGTAVLLLALPGLHIIEPGELHPSRKKWADIPLVLVYIHHLGVMFRYLLATVGFSVLLVGFVERRWRGSLTWLSLSWFLLAGLAASGMLLFFGEVAGERIEMRYAVLNPARAVLAALGLVWLLHWLNKAVRRLTGRIVRATHVLTGLALVSVALLVWQVLHHRAEYLATYRRESTQTCYFGYSTHSRYGRYFRLLLDELHPCWEPVHGKQVHVKTDESFAGFVGLLWAWHGGYPGRQEQEGESISLVMPRMPRVDVSTLPGGRRCGLVDVLHGGEEVHLEPTGTAGTLRPDGPLPPGGVLALYAHLDRGRPPRSVRLELDRRPLPPLDGCNWWTRRPIRAGTSGYQGWYLFRLPAGLQPGQVEIRLHVRLAAGQREYPKLVLLSFRPPDGGG